ncbi:MAG: hypothetical protein AAFS03_09165 [Pseudomonadota bacterium]
MRFGLYGLALLALAACGGGEGDPASGQPVSNAGSNGAIVQGGRDSGSGAFASIEGDYVTETRLSGKLLFISAEPLKASQVMMADFDRGSASVLADGFAPSSWGGDIAFVEGCGPLAVRLSVLDGDGFTSPISECVEEDVITPDFFAPAISPDGSLIAVTNLEIPSKETFEDPLQAWAEGKSTYAATQVYRRNGTLVAEFEGRGPSAFARDGRLILSGLSDDAGYGLYEADFDTGETIRIDDGRLNGPVLSIDAHPKNDSIVFVHNGALFEMDLGEGAPKRLYAHGYPLAAAAYSPNGKKIAFVSQDPLKEASRVAGPGYPLFVYEDGDVAVVRFAVIPGGRLDWVE